MKDTSWTEPTICKTCDIKQKADKLADALEDALNNELKWIEKARDVLKQYRGNE